jgi:CheY-like chemotaxis protein
MGGNIGFSSTPGQGSCFWVDIPVYPAGSAELEAATAATPAEQPHRSGFSVLYVEDNPASLLLVRNILSTLTDVTVIEAINGAMGLALAKQHCPDIIILDVDLPDTSGYAVLDHLKRMPGVAATPVLALSAGVLPHEIERGLAAGFFRYLTKPLEVKTFLGAIDAAVAEAQVRRTAESDLSGSQTAASV